MEILIVDEVAAMLRLSKWQVYELAKACTRQGKINRNPLLCVRINHSVRFLRKDVEEWIEKLRGRVG